MMDYKPSAFNFDYKCERKAPKNFIKELAFNTIATIGITCSIYYVLFTAAGV